MKTSKKVLGVVIALAMLLNIFTMFSFALGTESAVDLTMRVDKASYAPGETVTITLSEQVIPIVGEMTIAGNYAIGYDSSVIEMLTTDPDKIDLVADHGFVDLQPGFDNSISGLTYTDTNVNVQGDTIDATYGWDSVTVLQVAFDGVTSFDATTTPVDLCTFQMKLSDTVAPGDYVIGFNRGSYESMNGYSADITFGGIYGLQDDPESPLYNYGVDCHYSFGTATIHVGAAGPVVDKAAQQVKFTPDGASVADDFKLRVKSVITDADWDAYFANTGVASASTDAIQSVGIVAYKGTTGFDGDVAKGVVNGTPAANYEAAQTTYIQKADDASDAYFGAIINLKHSTCDYDITYMGFVKYLDDSGAPQVIFYPASYVAGVSTNYEMAKNAFLGA